jgi:hypothetical protein
LRFQYESYQKRLAADRAAAAEKVQAARDRAEEAQRKLEAEKRQLEEQREQERNEAMERRARDAQDFRESLKNPYTVDDAGRRVETDVEKARRERLQGFKTGVPIRNDEAENERGRAAIRKKLESPNARKKRIVLLSPDQVAGLNSVEMQSAIATANTPRHRVQDPRGQHGLIDRWLQATAKEIWDGEREALAVQIVNNPEASECLRKIELRLERRIRDDARRGRERRGSSHSFERDIDRS